MISNFYPHNYVDMHVNMYTNIHSYKCICICDQICGKGLRHTFILRNLILNIKYCVFREHMVPRLYAILHQSIIQDNVIGALFNGLLAKLPGILDSLITSTTGDHTCRGGVVGSHEVAGKIRNV